MTEKTIIVHDHRVYEELRKLSKANKRLALFAVISAVYIFALAKSHNEVVKKVEELTKEGE